MRAVLYLAVLLAGCANHIVIPCRDAHQGTESTDAFGHTFQATACDRALVVVIRNIQ